MCKNDFQDNKYSPENSQFDQVVWKGTNFLGLGRATKPKSNLLCTYIVARYSPPASKDSIIENVPKGNFNENQFCTERCTTGILNSSHDHDHDGPADGKLLFFHILTPFPLLFLNSFLLFYVSFLLFYVW